MPFVSNVSDLTFGQIDRCRFPVGATDGGTTYLRVDGDNSQPRGQRLPHDCAAAAALLKDLQLVLSIGTETPIPVANVINGLPPCRLTDNSR